MALQQGDDPFPVDQRAQSHRLHSLLDQNLRRKRDQIGSQGRKDLSGIHYYRYLYPHVDNKE